MKTNHNCTWMIRVSSLIDGELPEEQVTMVRAHAASCDSCRAILKIENFDLEGTGNDTFLNNESVGVSITRSMLLRLALGLLGAVVLFFAIINFVRGSSPDEGMHDLRHLGIWQGSLGLSLMVFSVTFRVSVFIWVTALSFITFTSAAFVVDVLLGHVGPWSDITHLVEVFALIFLLLLARPRLKFFVEAKREPRLFHQDV